MAKMAPAQDIYRPVLIPTRPGRVGIAALYLLLAALVARTLTWANRPDQSSNYVLLFSLFTLLFTALLWHPNLRRPLLHLYLIVESLVTLLLLSLDPDIDAITVLFIVLAFHSALLFTGSTRWVWVAILDLAIPISLVVFLGPLRGLSAGFLPMAVGIIVPAIVAANEETEGARLVSERLVSELQDAHEQLDTRARQVQEVAALEERSRLARELHDSVSQTIFAITLDARSAQVLLQRDPEKVRPQLEHLVALARNALAEMRQLIAERRP